ncbi:MAG: MotA/TolQ/ExbB proton channel family protein, partial [Gammaproteobacteria bacterium]
MKYRVLAVATVLLGNAVVAQEPAASLDEFMEKVRTQSLTRGVENSERERRFVATRDQQAALLREAEQSLADENTRSERLKTQFDDNEIELADLTETLLVRIGNMGELFGVVRQVAGDTKGIID